MKRILLLLLLQILAISMHSQGQVAHVRLTNLPHIYLETFLGDAITSSSNMVYARMWYVDEQDNVAYYDSLQVRVRGNSTSLLEKKPYKMKFPSKVKLLGKGFANAKKWTLLANHGDKTLLRNALTSAMGEWMGLKFNPAAKFVDLSLNGQYVGNYQLSDQIDVRPYRVDIVEQDYPLDSGSDISGGYLLEIDAFQDFNANPQGPNLAPSGFYTNSLGVPLRIHYPDEDEITPEQFTYIRNFINDFEERLFSWNFTDKLAGYRPLVDSVSLANWYICTEVSANVDGFFSAYFYKNRADNHIFWGPLWDYDVAYNNDNRTDRGGTDNTVHQLMKDYGYCRVCRQWVERMWLDPWFAQLVNRRFQEAVNDGLEDYLNVKLDSLVELLDASQKLNYLRWGINTQVLRERVLYSSYDRYVNDVRIFLQRHIKYLQTAFYSLQSGVPYLDDVEKVADFQADPGRYYIISNSKTGSCFDVNMASDELCVRNRDEESYSQQWSITNLSNGYLFIVNRATGQALYDPSPVGTTSTTNIGSTIMLADADSTDTRQLWDIVAQSDGQYNIVSRWSLHSANLYGGSSDDGTPVISYTSDGRNSSSPNRLWSIEATNKDTSSAINNVLEHEYALAYDSERQRLYFGADDATHALAFRVSIYNYHGHLVGSFLAADGFNMSGLPSGLYIVSWTYNDRREHVKMIK